ncbi:formylglycine-generating enzyme family protein [Nostoc sp. FACHB-190]|uniref:formylglycine-generating enzyme family protein n=1 Tax=Nostoc sp. FACHB-190 TaxID=2692838 RepID=UPI001688DA6B|nr:formylglycine-generating enzyme family protein [Nostoc sp. FACHB-190]MBD2303026.1 formylglycine-generating enzyme family protein [Nostoc sp. FACHB-190]
MNNEASHSMIVRFIDRLDEVKLLRDLSLDDEDIADIIWLALQMGVVEQPESSNREGSVIFEDIQKLLPDSNSSQSKTEVLDVFLDDSPRSGTQKREGDQKQETIPPSGFPFPVPAAPAIQNSLEIGRAMRPLKRKVPSTTKFILDEEATVNRIIERDIWQPVTKPEPERWLNLELIVEESRSSFIWQELIDDFQQILENQGAFRSIRVWTIKSENHQNQDSNLILIRRRRRGKLEQRQHLHRELIHPDNRGLILLVSDCVSPLWQNATLNQWLKDWSESQPTAIVQLFPERLWDSTQLSLGRKLFARALNPGGDNHKLILDDLPFWLPINRDDALVLPVLNLEPQILKLWARVVAGFGNARISTYLFDLEFIKLPENQRQVRNDNKSPVEISPQSQTSGNQNKSLEKQSPEVEAEQAKRIVKRFLATASPIAQRLAGMMAAAPVDISVVNLIRKTCLKEAQPVHVAEVYMGGLLRVTQEDTEGKSRVYDFIPGVRKVLNQAMAINETENILDEISKYIGERIDRPIRSFMALIGSLREIEYDQQEKVLPFAQIAVDVFQNIGGEYAELANLISANIQPVIPPVTPQVSVEPELKICDFEVATIEIIKFTSFKFVVATLERESESRRWYELWLQNKQRWVVKRQEKQAIGVVEKLGEGVNLELMEIPGGTFLMGSPESEQGRFESESPQHEVSVPKFYMGRYPITQGQWRVVAEWEKIDIELKPDPSRFKEDYQGRERWTRPVERVRWEEAKEFCKRLSRKTGREYRLPTEAEWEYGCRAGTTTPFHFGETITAEIANYNGEDVYEDGVKGEYRKQTTPVGYFQVANNFGLYDMHGNVWEWCEDDWHNSYKGAPNDGSAWIVSGTSNTKVCRGGSWDTDTRNCRCASRYNNDADFSYGFRVVRVPPRTE